MRDKKILQMATKVKTNNDCWPQFPASHVIGKKQTLIPAS